MNVQIKKVIVTLLLSLLLYLSPLIHIINLTYPFDTLTCVGGGLQFGCVIEHDVDPMRKLIVIIVLIGVSYLTTSICFAIWKKITAKKVVGIESSK